MIKIKMGIEGWILDGGVSMRAAHVHIPALQYSNVGMCKCMTTHIKIHSLMLIFILMMWSFPATEASAMRDGWHRGVVITQSHCRNSSAFLPWRNSVRVFLFNYLKVVTEINGVPSMLRALYQSFELSQCKTINIIQHLCTKFSKQQYIQYTTNTVTCTFVFLQPVTLSSQCESYGFRMRLRMLEAFYKAIEMSVGMYPSTKPTAFYVRFGTWDGVWEQRVCSIIHPEAQLSYLISLEH